MQNDSGRATEILGLLLQAERDIAAAQADAAYPLYELLHRVAARIVHADSFYICLYSAADETLFFPYNFDSGIYDHPETVPLGNGPTSWVVRNQRPFVLGKTNKATQRGNINFGDEKRESRSAVHVPMRVVDRDGAEQVLGVLSAQSYRRGAYDADAVQALQWLADRAALSLQHERDVEAWRTRAHNAEARAAQQSQAVAMSDEFVRTLRNITKKAEALQRLLPPDDPALQAAATLLCRACYQSQTEANQLPLRSHHPSCNSAPAQSDALRTLTKREREVLELLAAGHSNPAIARRLSISVDTVKHHCKNLYEKLDVSNRLQAVQAFTASDPSIQKTTRSGR